MQRILSISLIVIVLPSGATESTLRCSDLFSQEPQLRFSIEELNQEVAPTLSKIKTGIMANTILYTAQNKIAYESFSPELVNALRRTLEILLQAEKAQELAELPYKNETLRRRGKTPLSPKEIFGMDINLGLFGIEAPTEQIPLSEMDDSELVRARWLTADAVKNMYVRQAQQVDLFLNIGLKRSIDKLLKVGLQSKYLASETFDLENRQDGEVIASMFAAFLREALIREEVDKLLQQGRLNWPQNRQFMDRQILILATYPELLPFINRLPDFDFRDSLDFSSPEDIFATSYATLRAGSARASLSLIKQLERGRSEYIEWVEGYIEIYLLEPQDSENKYSKADNLATLHGYLRRAWQNFLVSKGFKESHLQLLVQGDDKILTLKVETAEEKISEIEVLAGFYLLITTQDRRDNYVNSLRFID